METTGNFSTVTRSELARLIGRLAESLPTDAPLPIMANVLPPGGTLCVHATDTGEPAFPAFPCRGHRIECEMTGITTYAAACRPGSCKHYEEDR